MLSQSEQNKIRNYLFSKNLPFDLLLEVEDHFQEQIENLMQKEMSFEEAFPEVKLLWKKDLKETYPWHVLNRTENGKITLLERRTKMEIEVKLLQIAFLVALITAICFMFLGKHLPFSQFKTSFIIVYSLPLFTAVIMYFIKMFSYSKLYKKPYNTFKTSIYEGFGKDIDLLLYCSCLYFLHLWLGTDFVKSFYSVSDVVSSYTILKGIALFIFFGWGIFLNLRFYKSLQSFRKIKTQIKAL